MDKSYKEATLEVCPTAVSSKLDDGQWAIFESEGRGNSITNAVAAANSASVAWEQAYNMLDPNMIKIPYDCLYFKKVGNEWVIDSHRGWKWVQKSDYVPFQEATYRINIEESSSGTYGGKFFWTAYSDDHNPLYYRFTTNKTHLTRIDCKIEIEEIVKQFGLKAYYEIVHIEKDWIK